MRSGIRTPGPESFYYQCGPEGIVVIDCGPGGSEDVVGRTLAEIAAARGVDPERVVIDLLLETRMSALVILHYAEESVVKAIARHPAMLVGSDAVFASTPIPGCGAPRPGSWGVTPSGKASCRFKRPLPGYRTGPPGGSG